MNRVQQGIITFGQVVLSLGLLPTIVASEKPAVVTSLINVIILYSFTIVFATSKMKFPAISSLLGVVLWFILLLQGAFR